VPLPGAPAPIGPEAGPPARFPRLRFDPSPGTNRGLARLFVGHSTGPRIHARDCRERGRIVPRRGSHIDGTLSDNPSVGAFSPPLRLTGRLLELWASDLDLADDEILGRPQAGEVIPLRTGNDDAPAAPVRNADEETPLRRTAGRRDSR
jgi:hypothetical protein